MRTTLIAVAAIALSASFFSSAALACKSGNINCRDKTVESPQAPGLVRFEEAAPASREDNGPKRAEPRKNKKELARKKSSKQPEKE